MNLRFRSILVLLVVSVCALAQDYRATLTGIVTDPSGAAVPDATVRATNVTNNSAKEAKTTSIGNYTIPYLDPGIYNVEVVAAGFQRILRKDIVLRVADKVNLPIQLAVGQAAESITVTAEQAVIETASADRGLVFDPLKTQQYPLNGRQTYALLGLTPGVIFTNEAFGPGGHSGQRGWDVTNSYKINGARPGQNLFLLNGAPISDNQGTWQLAPNVEAVQEFKVMTNTYDASYGRFGGGVVNTTIKGGGNDWHGNVFDYFRNTVLDANRTENKQRGTERPKHNQHQFGGVFGGPLRKDKDFVFFSFEGFREIQPASVISSVPAAGLADGQHFSDYGIKIYDPMTSRPCLPTENCRGSAYIRDPFPGNVIPRSRISPVGQKVLSYFPAANGPDPKALTGNYYTNTNGRYRYDQPMGRWDHNFSDFDKLYVLVTYQHGKEYRNSTGFAPPAGSGDINSQRTDQNYVAAWTHVLSPTSVLDVRASYGRFTSEFPRYTDYDFTVDQLGMTQMPHAPTNPKASVPRFELSTLTPLFSGGSAGEWNTYNQWNLTPSIMRTTGNHTLRMGFEVNYVARAVGDRGYSNGYMYFNQDWTRQLSSVGGGTFDGSSIAGLLLGYADSDSRVDWNNNPYRTRPYYGIYFQDDWKVTRTLTLNLGLRYDVQVPWKERFNRSNRGFDLTAKNPLSDQVLANWRAIKAEYDATNPRLPYPNPPAELRGGFLFPGVGNQPSRLYDTDWTNIGPRIGVAWQILPRTVLRAGGGVYYMSPTQDNTQTGFSQSTPFVESIDGLTPSAGLSLNGAYSLVNPFPTGIQQPLGASEGLLTYVGRGVSWDPARFKIPRTYQYSFGIQQQLPGSVVAEVSYAGNYQIYINASHNYNEASLADRVIAQNDAPYLSLQIPNPFYGILPANGGQGQNPTINRGGLMRANPIFQGMTDNLSQWGRYRSDALQTKIEKRMLGGANTGNFTWVLSHTFAKGMEQNHRLNNWNFEEPLIYEVDNNHKPHTLSFSGVWDLPIGRGRKFLNPANSVLGQLASGWQTVWIYTYASGYPTGWPDLVNKCGTWHAAEQTRNSWFNNDKSCYTTRPANTIRTNPDRFSDILNPSQKQLNLAVEKTTRLSERYRFVIRAEAFNITNTPNYAGPNTDFNSDRFGRLPDNQQNWPRLVQLSAKFFF
jgi:hypothetical protein